MAMVGFLSARASQYGIIEHIGTCNKYNNTFLMLFTWETCRRQAGYRYIDAHMHIHVHLKRASGSHSRFIGILRSV